MMDNTSMDPEGCECDLIRRTCEVCREIGDRRAALNEERKRQKLMATRDGYQFENKHKELCDWLRMHSSGAYRKSEIAADIIEEQELEIAKLRGKAKPV